MEDSVEQHHSEQQSPVEGKDRRFGDDISKSKPANSKANDPLLPQKEDDPRTGKKIKTKGAGRNTESFDPKSTLVRPDMRIIVGPNVETYKKKIKHVCAPIDTCAVMLLIVNVG
jgi:hypothetical protein